MAGHIAAGEYDYPLTAHESLQLTADLTGGGWLRGVREHLACVVHSGARWCKDDDMAVAEKNVRQSVTLSARLGRRVKSLAKTSNMSANRIIVELIESGIEARQQQRKRFIELADRLARSRDVEEQTRLKEELAVMTFGE
jgi:hypothetical protein